MNLTKLDIRAHIDRAMAEAPNVPKCQCRPCGSGLAKIAFVNAADVINAENATLQDDASEEDTAAIQSVKVKTFGEDGTGD